MSRQRWSTTRILTVGFILIILTGALLLCLPAASRSHRSISFLSALFTSTSATCVTGLALFDTWNQFTYFGQAVILVLIQIGGIGFMTITIMFSILSGRRIGLRERDLLAEAVSCGQLGGIVRLIRRTLLVTVSFELLGAGLLCLRFVPLLGFWRGLWFSLFHSVSAYCNAGFDLMGALGTSPSLTAFTHDPLVLLTIGVLIIMGGVGFVVWNDLIENRFRLRRVKLHTHVVLWATFSLLVIGTVLFWCFEQGDALAGYSPGQQLLVSFFQSVTPRTAGFSAVEPSQMTEPGRLLTMVLMFIGAAPGSTGGGIKVTTLIVVIATVRATIGNREDVSISHYRLDGKTLRHTFCNITIYLGMALAGIFVLCTQGQTLRDAAFESFSAIGTVGLSTGITADLAPLSQIAIILLMYAGRMGSLTVFLAVSTLRKGKSLRDPIGKIIVG